MMEGKQQGMCCKGELTDGEVLPARPVHGQELREDSFVQILLHLAGHAGGTPDAWARAREGAQHGRDGRRRDGPPHAGMWAPAEVDVVLVGAVQAHSLGIGELGRIPTSRDEVGEDGRAGGD